MLEIKSAINSSLILASYFESSKLTYERLSLTNNEDLLQVGAVIFPKKFRVKAHRHLPIDRKSIQVTQELWILIKGEMTVEVYDLDNSLAKILEMNSGDMVLYKNGGHSLVTKNKECILYEIKNGPYFGPDIDKEYF
jgi:cupin fold WbuC family metalloprotein